MFTFERKANYYETDQMGIVHHSNYIRWFEEARLEMLRAMVRRLCLHCAFKTTTVYALKWRMRGTARRPGF